VQAGLEDLLLQLENTTYIDPIYTESWLRSFLDYVERWRDYPDYDQLKTNNEQNFIRTLKDVSRFYNLFECFAPVRQHNERSQNWLYIGAVTFLWLILEF
jgi:hypothetical protein